MKFDQTDEFYFPNKHQKLIEEENELISSIDPVNPKKVVVAVDHWPLYVLPDAPGKSKQVYLKISNFPRSQSDNSEILTFLPFDV